MPPASPPVDASHEVDDSRYQRVFDLVQKACLDYAKAEPIPDAIDRAETQAGVVATVASDIVAYYDNLPLPF